MLLFCLQRGIIERSLKCEENTIYPHCPLSLNGVGEHGIQAFTDFGIENLIELVRMYKESPELLKRWPSE